MRHTWDRGCDVSHRKNRDNTVVEQKRRYAIDPPSRAQSTEGPPRAEVSDSDLKVKAVSVSIVLPSVPADQQDMNTNIGFLKIRRVERDLEAKTDLEHKVCDRLTPPLKGSDPDVRSCGVKSVV